MPSGPELLAAKRAAKAAVLSGPEMLAAKRAAQGVDAPDSRAPAVRVEGLSMADLAEDATALRSAVLRAAKEDGRDDTEAALMADDAAREFMAVGPGADTDGTFKMVTDYDRVRKALEARHGPATVGKAFTMAFGQRVEPLPLAEPAPEDRDRDWRDKERLYRGATTGRALAEAWKGEEMPPQTAEQVAEAGTDKPWLRRAGEMAGDLATVGTVAPATVASLLGMSRETIHDLHGTTAGDLWQDVKDAPGTFVDFLEDPDVQRIGLSTAGMKPEEVDPWALAHTASGLVQLSGAGQAVGAVVDAGAKIPVLGPLAAKAAKATGIDGGQVAVFWDDASTRDAFDAANAQRRETGDRAGIGALTLRDLPARLQGTTPDVERIVREAQGSADPALAPLQGILDRPAALQESRVMKIPLASLQPFQANLIPTETELDTAFYARRNAEKWGGKDNGQAFLRLLGAGLIKPLDDGDQVVFVPSRFMEVMRLAGVPLELIGEADVNPWEAAAMGLLGPVAGGKAFDALAPEKMKAARLPTKAGVESMVRSGAFDDVLESMGFEGGGDYNALRDPESTYASRILANVTKPEYIGAIGYGGYGDTFERAGGDPESTAGKLIDTAALASDFLIPVEHMVILPVSSTAGAVARGTAASRAARAAGLSGAEARQAAIAAAAPVLLGHTDGIAAANAAIKSQLLGALKSGRYSPDALPEAVVTQLTNLFREAGIKDAPAYVKRLIGELRDRHLRILDRSVTLQTKAGPAYDALRSSHAYRAKLVELDSFVQNGTLTPLERDVSIRLLEAEAGAAVEQGAVRTMEEYLARHGWTVGTDADLANPHPAALFSRDVESTPAFQAWFGGSKVVDADGAPVVVYHGTEYAGPDGHGLTTFASRPDAHAGFHFGTREAADAKLIDDTRDWADRGRSRPDLLVPDSDRAATQLRVSARRAELEAERSAIQRAINERAAPLDTDALGAALESGDEARIQAAFNRPPAEPTVEEASRLALLMKKEEVLDGDLRAAFAYRRTGENVIPAYLSIKNPARMNDTNWGDAARIRQDNPDLRLRGTTPAGIIRELQARGFDGIVYKNNVEAAGSESWIAFEPTQIKSATGNRGTFDPADPNILYSTEAGVTKGSIQTLPDARPLAPAFYSALRRAVEALKQEKMAPDQLRAALRNTPGVKADEINWTRLDDLLAGKRSVTKREVLDWLDENAVVVEERVLSDAPNPRIAELSARAWRLTREERTELAALNGIPPVVTRYRQYQLPGGTNYRERLFKLPKQRIEYAGELPDGWTIAREPGHGWLVRDEAGKAWQGGPDRDALLAKVRSNLSDGKADYHAPHFGQGDNDLNLLAHVRLSDRKGPNGEKILHVEEVQSDWHQAGREKGYATPENAPDVLYATWQRKAEQAAEAMEVDDIARLEAEADAAHAAWTAAKDGDLVPPAPFARNWHELAMKRVLREAAEGGYDGISWTTGKTQVARYEDATRQAVDEVRWARIPEQEAEDALAAAGLRDMGFHPPGGDYKSGVQLIGMKNGREVYRQTMAPEKVGDVIGKGMAAKIAESPEASGTLAGADLTIGGEGMKGFYDVKLRNDLNAYVKKWDTRAGMTEIEVKPPLRESERAMGNDEWNRAYEAARAEPVHYLPLTDKLRAAVLHEGQPLFQRTGGTVHGSIEPAPGPTANARYIIRLFRTGDVDTAFHEASHLLDLMLGPAFTERAAKALGYSATDIADALAGRNPTMMTAIRERIADAGARLARRDLRPGSPLYNTAREAWETLSDLWNHHVKGIPDVVTPEMRRLWNRTFRPNNRPVAAALEDARQPRGFNAPVIEAESAAEAVKQAKVLVEGQRRNASNVARSGPELRASLGLKSGQATVDPLELTANALAYIATEKMRRKWGFGELVALTSRMAVPRNRAKEVFLDADRHRFATVGKVADPVADVFHFDPDQARGVRRLIDEVADSPIGETLPARLLDPAADLSTLSAKEWNTLNAHLVETKAGAGAWREMRAEKAMESGAIHLFDRAVEVLGDTDRVAPYVAWFKDRFSVSHAGDRYVGAAQLDVLKAMERDVAAATQALVRDIRTVAADLRRADTRPLIRRVFGRANFTSVDVLRRISDGMPPEVVPLSHLDDLTSIQRALSDAGAPPGQLPAERVAINARPIHQLFVASPIEGVAQTTNEITALTTMDRVGSRMAQGMDFQTALADVGVTLEQADDAMNMVLEGLRRRSVAVHEAAADILVRLAGSQDRAVLKAIAFGGELSETLRDVYRNWYSGQWDELLRTTIEMGRAASGRHFDQGSAALAVLMRLKQRQVFSGFARRMAEVGVIGDVADLGKSGIRFDRNYTLGALPQGVEGHIADVADYIRSITGWTDTPTIRLGTPGRYIPGKGEMTSAGRVNPEAYADAHRILASWGFKHGEGLNWTAMDMPGGSRVLVPDLIREPIARLLDEAAPEGMAWRSSGPRVGDVTSGAAAVRPPPDWQKAISTIVGGLETSWAWMLGSMKTGMTTGVLLPNPVYYMGNFIGGMAQMYQGVGAARTLGIMARGMVPGGMTQRVLLRLWKNGEGVGGFDLHSPATTGFFTKGGEWWSDKMVAEAANRAGMNTSQAAFELSHPIIEDIKRLEPTWKNALLRAPREWQAGLIEASTVSDNFYRVGTFMDELRAGKAEAQAGTKARHVGYDYGAMTEFEQNVMRRGVMFYSYMRRNQDLFWRTLLENPHRVLGQLRLMNGLQKVNLDDTSGMLTPQYLDGRAVAYFTREMVEGQAERTKQGRAMILPQLPMASAIDDWLDLLSMFNLEQEGAGHVAGRMHPFLNAVYTMATEKDVRMDRDLEDFDTVPNWLVEMDRNMTGGMLVDSLLRVDRGRWFDPSMEPYPSAPRYIAKNTKAWWVWRNLLQVPGAGRSMTTIDAMHRAGVGSSIVDGGVAQGALDLTRAFAEAQGREPERETDVMTPRMGLTEAQEWATWAGLQWQTIDHRDQVRAALMRRKSSEIRHETNQVRETMETGPR